MKQLRIALLVLFSIPPLLQAQIAECGNGISTDPRNSSNADRPEMENTFYWFPHNGDNHANFDFLTKGGITYTGITNPFWAFTTTLPVGQLFGQDESDFYPEDGWELLKVNFGYLLDGSPRIDPPAMPYMALYNKYSGTIRFLGMWPN